MPYPVQPRYQPKDKLEYRSFRVRGHIKSFRDLEIYKQTTLLSSQIFKLNLPPNLINKKRLEEELQILHGISKQIPRLIAESYGNKFTNRLQAYDKLEEAMQYASQVIAKLDFLIAAIDHLDTKQTLVKMLQKYEVQRRKTLNLKRAWERVEKKINKEPNIQRSQ